MDYCDHGPSAWMWHKPLYRLLLEESCDDRQPDSRVHGEVFQVQASHDSPGRDDGTQTRIAGVFMVLLGPRDTFLTNLS